MDLQPSVYIYIGQRIRERRKLLKLSQSQLAEMMGFSYQQIQKYENGTSHVSAGKLLLFARILNVPPGHFFDGLAVEEAIGQRIASDIIQLRTEPLGLLLADDDPRDAVLLRQALASCSERAEVHMVYDAREAMDFLLHHDTKFGQRRPDVLVIALAAPKAGLDLLRSVKKHPRLLDLPALMLSHSVKVKDMTEAYRCGAAGFIQKSADLSEYAESLDAALKYWARAVALPCHEVPPPPLAYAAGAGENGGRGRTQAALKAAYQPRPQYG